MGPAPRQGAFPDIDFDLLWRVSQTFTPKHTTSAYLLGAATLNTVTSTLEMKQRLVMLTGVSLTTIDARLDAITAASRKATALRRALMYATDAYEDPEEAFIGFNYATPIARASRHARASAANAELQQSEANADRPNTITFSTVDDVLMFEDADTSQDTPPPADGGDPADHRHKRARTSPDVTPEQAQATRAFFISRGWSVPEGMLPDDTTTQSALGKRPASAASAGGATSIFNRAPAAHSEAWYRQEAALAANDDYTGIRADLHQNTLLQARNRRALHAQGKLPGGFGSASCLDNFEMPLRASHHKRVQAFEIDFCFVSYALGRAPKQKAVIAGFTLETEEREVPDGTMDILERVSSELATSISIWHPGGGAEYYRDFIRRVKRRARSYGVQLALRYERQHRALAARLFRTAGVLSTFEVDPELEAACFGGMAARTCEICGGPHFTDQHEDKTRKNDKANKDKAGPRVDKGNREKVDSPCRDWASKKGCRFKDKCKYVHDPAKKGSG